MVKRILKLFLQKRRMAIYDPSLQIARLPIRLASNEKVHVMLTTKSQKGRIA
jgi:hypothetical protein